ncbi:peptide chain release factor N(5)-glutamine methyltransferase [Sneathiella sp.]|uniref:peptide chain release factor N(5)-glutamine methyltransferase n=1 Tax=Sneathiella sp. TaxID=1964365 RepID=UPI003566CBB3
MELEIQQAVRAAAGRLEATGVENPRRDATVLLAFVLGEDTGIFHRSPERYLSTREQADFNRVIERRATREPVSHITGQREFWSLDFAIGPAVLDPRPDSETLIEVALDKISKGHKVRNILDLGTGSGCLLLSLLSEIPDATGVGVDISDRALLVARKNAEHLGLQARSKFQLGNWCAGIHEQFDLVLCNPPYIPAADVSDLQPEVRDFEPHLALIGGADGLDCYRNIIFQLPSVLRSRGLVLFEVGSGQAAAVGGLLEESGFINVEFHIDLASIDRCVSAYRGK